MNQKYEEVFKKLYDKISEDGIQRTDKEQTKKGYSTTGFGYQWIVDDLNNLFGFDWNAEWEIINVREGQREYTDNQNKVVKRTYFEITVKVIVSIEFEARTFSRTLVGGHVSSSYTDALKGAISNGIKKTAALFGVGSEAFRGEIDDDNGPDSTGEMDSGESKVYRLDFNDVVKNLKSLVPENMKGYYESILKSFPNLSQPQLKALKAIFEKAFADAAKPKTEVADFNQPFSETTKSEDLGF